MKRLLLVLALACGLLYAGAPTARPSTVARPSAARAENDFAFSLLRAIGGNGNVVYSPFSIDLALTMAAAGARGQTVAQMARVLHAPSAAAAVSYASSLRSALVRAIDGSGGPMLNIANALWTQSGLPLEQPFVATLTTDFGAPPQSTDFARSPGAALAAINAWVSSHTDSLIPAVLGPGSITPETAFVLANAIYLRAHWEDTFEDSETAPGAFTTASRQRIEIPFMNQRGASYDYASGSTYQAVNLPYRRSSLSLLALLPRGESLARFDRALSGASWGKLIASLAPASVNLAMPRLDLSSEISLNGPLREMGMTAPFGTGANFSDITSQRRLYISLVQHAAVLKVDEAGTTAAGTTVVVAPTAAVPLRTRSVSVRLDHPYLLVLYDDTSHTILFVARVADPTS